ncbi:hypothetical protein GCM10009769_13310 [Curtobacterium luteum]|uniref:Gram-positive cocci surface proteins LPxTG domain-containing protein n=1 Tax=Curtobacterium luteum TaxID=33881 RepID=A0A8H9GC53_9MICO|nr:hypothetical protein GCM10009769_13310 [Curtobacterium luteum]
MIRNPSGPEHLGENVRRSTSTVRRACALGTTAALVVLTTGLGVMTATAANAETVSEPTPTATVDPTPSDASTDPTTDPTATPTPTGEPDSSATADPAPTTGEPAPAKTTAPAKPLLPGSGSSTQDVTPAAVAAPTVTITGTAKVGSTLKATTTGFDKELATPEFVWTNQATKEQLSNDQFYDLQPTDVGAVIVVTVTGKDSEGTDVKASAKTAEVTQDPVFVDASGTPIVGGTVADEDTLFIDDATAGEAYSYTFRAEGYPAPTYQLSWYYGDEEDSIGNVVETQSQAAAENTLGAGFESDADVNGDGEITPDDQLPKGITFDPATGELSGTATEASWYDFAVTATSGDVSTTQYVELTVDPGAAYGLAAVALDKGLIDNGKGAEYIIRPDGTVLGFDLAVDEDGFPEIGDLRDHVSVKQGGTLLVYGSPVDRFGNDVYPEDENDVVQATVTSDVASDVIKPYTENGAEGYGVSSVTFPHASTHRLSVSAQALEPISFDVEVQPVAAPAVVVTPTATGTGTGVQLAYTGSDATGALPWALGLVLAGAGLIGARTLRRRRAQR